MLQTRRHLAHSLDTVSIARYRVVDRCELVLCLTAFSTTSCGWKTRFLILCTNKPVDHPSPLSHSLPSAWLWQAREPMLQSVYILSDGRQSSRESYGFLPPHNLRVSMSRPGISLKKAFADNLSSVECTVGSSDTITHWDATRERPLCISLRWSTSTNCGMDLMISCHHESTS